MVALSSWGRLGQWPHTVVPLTGRDTVAQALADSTPGIAHGAGRSYGDICLNPGGTAWQTRALDRFIHFDADSGLLECEAGVLLRDIQQVFGARGWMLPVTPGTQVVTVGGAVANDVHGKNHHRAGTFGEHIRRLGVVRTDGELIECGPGLREEWFRATVGGLGLTGIIATATLQLRRVDGPWITANSLPFHSLEEFFQLSEASEKDWEYTVAWVDCVARRERRGIFFRGNHALPRDHSGAPERYSPRSLTLPFTPPVSLVNRLSLRPFNAAYYHLHRLRQGTGRVHYEPFFYPLDGIGHWNRMYGPRGFYQYQCLVPPEAARDVIAAMLAETANSSSGSFLAVLKTFGERDPAGLLSFPRPGVTLALDFPNGGERTLELMRRLDALLRGAGGRLYPAKDARMPRDLFESGYPQLEEFRPFRDPGISSALSRRLLGS